MQKCKVCLIILNLLCVISLSTQSDNYEHEANLIDDNQLNSLCDSYNYKYYKQLNKYDEKLINN